MIKIGLVSDLHLEFWNDTKSWDLLIAKINEAKCDVVLNAGDIHPRPEAREYFHSRIQVPYAYILGNHDFYGRQHLQVSHFVVHKNGLKIIGCTLWTDFKKHDSWVMLQFPNALADGTQILPNETGYQTLAEEIYELHNDDLQWIEDEKPDVVVTHHAPSMHSVHPMFYRTGDMNFYFVSELDQFILDHPNIKLWMHGHTHNPVDYKIGETRVVANQLAYPSERFNNVNDYEVNILEV